MANGFAKAWNYVSAWFSSKVDEKADPKIQIQQAIEQAQRQHASLTAQAASVIGQQHQLELQLDRKLAEIESLQQQARQALVLVDQSRAQGDEAKAAEFEETAGHIANQLVSAESEAANLKQLHDQSMGAAQQAKRAVQDNRQRLQEKLNERTKLLSQLEQAKMQEQVSASLSQMGELSAPGNTPSLDAVRDKIERRYANALGQAELANDTMAGRLQEVKRATSNLAAQSRLAEIRASMSGEKLTQTGEPSQPLSAQPQQAIANQPASPATGSATTGQPATQPASAQSASAQPSTGEPVAEPAPGQADPAS
jgi:phage shock protein A